LYSPYKTTLFHSIGLICASKQISIPASSGLYSFTILLISFACQ
jgi:hypothetical protein